MEATSSVILEGASTDNLAGRQPGIRVHSPPRPWLGGGAPICQVPPMPGGVHGGGTGGHAVEDSKPVLKEVMDIEVFALTS